MKCPGCRGSLFDEGQFAVAEMVAGRPVLLQNTPALRCRQCGDLVISAQTARRIQRALVDGAAQGTTQAYVYDLSPVVSEVRRPVN
ncbi:MAG: hypothetical protein ACR2PL_19995 [Dehalococcoidia bacterium]